MSRRATYQFGTSLPRGERGSVDAGLGKIDGVGAVGRSVLANDWAARGCYGTLGHRGASIGHLGTRHVRERAVAQCDGDLFGPAKVGKARGRRVAADSFN